MTPTLGLDPRVGKEEEDSMSSPASDINLHADLEKERLLSFLERALLSRIVEEEGNCSAFTTLGIIPCVGEEEESFFGEPTLGVDPRGGEEPESRLAAPALGPVPCGGDKPESLLAALVLSSSAQGSEDKVC